MFYSVSLFSQAPLARGSRALPSVLLCIMQLPLVVILKNENKGDEMVDIMAHLHQYVQSINYSEKKVISTGGTIEKRLNFIRFWLVGIN